jgi:hypothetical protein
VNVTDLLVQHPPEVSQNEMPVCTTFSKCGGRRVLANCNAAIGTERFLRDFVTNYEMNEDCPVEVQRVCGWLYISEQNAEQSLGFRRDTFPRASR